MQKYNTQSHAVGDQPENGWTRVELDQAKTHLSKLVEQAARGESFIIAKAGKPLVKVVPLDAPTSPLILRLGFLGGQLTIPDYLDRRGGREIERLFGGGA